MRPAPAAKSTLSSSTYPHKVQGQGQSGLRIHLIKEASIRIITPITLLMKKPCQKPFAFYQRGKLSHPQYGMIFAMQKNYYKVLQVDPSADPEVIAAAYKRLSLKYHPDTNDLADANQRMQDLNEAYQVLNDPARRAHYDYLLKDQNGASYEDEGNIRRRVKTGRSPRADSPTPSRPSAPQHALANLIVSLSFPLTYILLIYFLFRIFRSPNIIVVLALVIIAGLAAYRVSAHVERLFRLRR
jgi:DnaJ-domain-containing protein 1